MRQWRRPDVLFEANGLSKLEKIRLALPPQEAVGGGGHDVVLLGCIFAMGRVDNASIESKCFSNGTQADRDDAGYSTKLEARS